MYQCTCQNCGNELTYLDEDDYLCNNCLEYYGDDDNLEEYDSEDWYYRKLAAEDNHE